MAMLFSHLSAKMQDAIRSLDAGKFAPMGDSRKVYAVELTEPEINGIYAFVAFVKHACVIEPFTKFWSHYGETMQGLSDRLAEFDDAPAQAEKKEEKQ